MVAAMMVPFGFGGAVIEEREPDFYVRATPPPSRGPRPPKSDEMKLRELEHERDYYVQARAKHRRPYARIKVFARLARMDEEIARLRAKVGTR